MGEIINEKENKKAFLEFLLKGPIWKEEKIKGF